MLWDRLRIDDGEGEAMYVIYIQYDGPPYLMNVDMLAARDPREVQQTIDIVMLSGSVTDIEVIKDGEVVRYYHRGDGWTGEWR